MGRIDWRRWRWPALAAIICLVLAPVISVIEAAALRAAASQTEGTDIHVHGDGTAHSHGQAEARHVHPGKFHVHPDGTAHEHGEAMAHHGHPAGVDNSADAAKPVGKAGHALCDDGCCLGKGCPMCGLGLVADGQMMPWYNSGCFGFVPTPAAAGIAPAPASEPPRL